ncbi:MAG: crossover junction endodeoxyribonuclease RuvC [Candidatus Omnitrophica bacterium]|nr:crossover junction endodeoxyribonuclease RuvC [Candidatus Omnitrophota bacterium]
MIILGIDPGLKATGYGVVHFESNINKLLEAGTIEPKQKSPIQDKIGRIYSIVGELIDNYRPDVLVLEKLFAHYKHPITAAIMGHARGVICLLCSQKKVRLSELSPKRVRKAVTGNGNASKVQTKRVVAYLLKVDEEKLTLDASDALALALGFTQIEGRLG